MLTVRSWINIDLITRKKLSLTREEVSSKEKILTSGIRCTTSGNSEQNGKPVLEITLLKQMHNLENSVDVDKLQKEVTHLIYQKYATTDERNRITSEVVDLV